MKIESLSRLLPEDLIITLADVGSAGGLHKRWLRARPKVAGLLFEPREGGTARRAGNDIIYPIALGPDAGTATLNVTALANMSSILRPSDALLQSYARKYAHTRIVETFDMPVDTLDALASREGTQVDALKVDTQGSELGILQGASQCLKSTIFAAEVEVSFFQRYEGQAVFCDIEAFMVEHGFELLDLQRLKRYRRANSAGIGNRSLGAGQRAGRLAYGDAIFFLREDLLHARLEALDAGSAESLALKAVLVLVVYGKPDMAAHLFDLLSFAVREPFRGEVGSWLKRHGRGPLRAGVLHHVTDWLARHV